MRAAIITAAVLALCVMAATYVAAAGFGVCVFQGSSDVTGYFTFQQEVSGGDVTVIANFTSHKIHKALYLHFHTFGDMDLPNGENECWTNLTLGPYAAPTQPHHILKTSWVSGINLFDSNSIIGRRGALFGHESSCPDGLRATPIAECIVGVRNVASQATNTAGQYLEENPTSGYAKIFGTTGCYGDNSAITGKAWFVPTSDNLVYVSIHIRGLTANTNHAVHVHAWGDISSNDALSAGGHLNPYDLVHGYPPNPIRHMGDMGNITSNSEGVAKLEDTFDIMSLTASVGNLLGRAVVLHSLGDDGNPTGSSTSTGNAGGRLAKALIGISSRLPADYDESASKARIAASKLITLTTSDAPARADEAPALAVAAPEEAPQPPADAPTDDATTTTTTTLNNRKARSAPAVLIACQGLNC